MSKNPLPSLLTSTIVNLRSNVNLKARHLRVRARKVLALSLIVALLCITGPVSAIGNATRPNPSKADDHLTPYMPGGAETFESAATHNVENQTTAQARYRSDKAPDPIPTRYSLPAGNTIKPVLDASRAISHSPELRPENGTSNSKTHENGATGASSVNRPLAGLAAAGALKRGAFVASSSNGLSVSVGYADNLRPSANFPSPWQGAPNTIFFGGGASVDAGAIRIDNSNPAPVTVDRVVVNLGRPGPAFSLWGSFTIPANGSAILTQTAPYNFDTSNFPITACGAELPPGETRIPKITITAGGASSEFLDAAHVLDTGGYNLGCQGSKNLQWRPIGTTGINKPGGRISLIPETAITPTGATYAAQATVTDADGQPLADVAVSLEAVAGPNAGLTRQAITDANGVATFSYSSSQQGVDFLQASITNAARRRMLSDEISASWSSADACPTPPPPPGPGETRLAYLGPLAADYGDLVTLSALLTDGIGAVIAGRQISFNLGTQTASGVTGSNGVASITIAPSAAPGVVPLTVSFAGDSTFAPSQASTSFTVEAEETAINYTGKVLLGTAAPQQVTAVLVEGGDHPPIPVANKVLTFQVGSVSATATTDSNGVATATITLGPSETSGPSRLAISFAGDAFYKPSFTAIPVTVYLSTSFVVWGGNTGRLRLGQRVNFWGHSWASQVTGGDYGANPSFKGFADPVAQVHVCQPNARTHGSPRLDDSCWTSKPGQSFPPPLTLPAYIEVIVSTSIDKQGSKIFGNIAAAAVVKVDPNPPYGPDPGHPGYGVIVALIEDGNSVFPKPPSLTATQTQPERVVPGQSFRVNLDVANNSTTDAENVTMSESFNGLTPASASDSLGQISAGAHAIRSFQETVPSVPSRRIDESNADYLTRLASTDERLVTSTATIIFSDSAGQTFLPVEVSSSSQIELPRLTVGLRGIPCVGPGTRIPYEVTVANIGSGMAATATVLVTLPDGTSAAVPITLLAPGASFTSIVNFTVPLIPAGGSTSEYLTRLASFDGSSLTAAASAVWTDTFGNPYGAVDQQYVSIERVPVLTETAQTPASMLPGQTTATNFTVSNIGGGNAVQVNLRVTNPDNTVSAATPFSLPANQTTSAPATTWTAPVVSPKQPGESESAYQTRLASIDGSLLNFALAMDWTGSNAEGYGPTTNIASAQETLPIVTVALGGPLTANSGDTITYTATITNPGHADASSIDLAITLPDGSVQRPSLPPGLLAPGASAQATVSFTVPSTQPDGSLEAHAAVSWHDAVQNAYGPLSAAATTVVNSTNQPPLVSAGPNQTISLPTHTVFMSGTASDDGKPEGSALTTRWTKLSGLGDVSFADADQLVTQATFSSPGVYVFELSASDGQFTVTDSTVVTVLPGNQPPIVNAGPDLVLNSQPFTAALNGIATDDGLPSRTLSVTWTQVSGPGTIAFANPNQVVTQATFSAVGVYQVRLTANDGQLSASDDAIVSVGTQSVTLSPSNAGPNVVGTSQMMTATLTDGSGAPISGSVVSFTVSGANAATGTSTTDASGIAMFSYTGSNVGTDTVKASVGTGGAQLNSNTATIDWIAPRQTIATSTLNALFFTSNGSGTFDIPPTQQPVFTQTVPTIDYNPPNGAVPGNTTIGVTTHPFTDVTTDTNGLFTGTIPAQGNGLQAGVDTLSNFKADFQGSFFVGAAGDITFNFYTDDGFYLGIGGGATRVGGALVNPPASGTTAFLNLPIMGSFNVPTAPVGNTITVHFPGPGTYPYEVGFAECCGGELVLTMSTNVSGINLPVPPLGSLTIVPPSMVAQPAGGQISFAILAQDATGTPQVNLPITVSITGANARTLSATTDSNGRATFIYPGANAGQDLIQATAVISGGQFPSNVLKVQWNDATNAAPFVNAGPDQTITLPTNIVTLNGSVSDDGRPAGAPVTSTWSRVAAPGIVTFSDVHSPVTSATFSQPGVYVLRLSANDTQLTGSDDVTIKVGTACIQAPSGLVNWWPAEGDSADIHGTANGTAMGGAGFAPGLDGQSFTFNGATGYVALPDDFFPFPSPAGSFPAFTLDGWFKTTSGGVIVGQQVTSPFTTPSDYVPGVYVGIDGRLYAQMFRQSPIAPIFPTSVKVNDGVFHHFAVTFDGTSQKLYLDGALAGTKSIVGSVGYASSYKYQFGTGYTLGWPGGNNGWFTFNGLLDEVHIFNRALSQTEVIAISLADLNGLCAPPNVNQAPTVNAGADQTITLPTNAVTLVGSVSDDGLPTGGNLAISWSQVSRPGTVTFSNPDQSATQASFPGAGTFELRLTANDGQLSSSDTVFVTVNPNPNANNQPPTVTASSPVAVTIGSNLILNPGNESAPSGGQIPGWTQISGTWSQAPPAGVGGIPAAREGTTFFYAGNSTSAELRQDIDVSALAASINAGTQQFDFKAYVRSAAETAPDTTRIIVEFRDASNSTALVTLDTGPLASVGQWSPVTDTRSAPIGTAIIRIRLIANLNTGPSNDAYFDGVSLRALANAGALLSGSVSDDGLPLGAPLRTTWSNVSGPGDVSFSTPFLPQTAASFSAPGTYIVRLTGDDSQLSSSADVSVSISAANLAPAVNAGPDRTISLPTPATLNGTVNDDGLPQGSSVTISWTKVSGPGSVTFSPPDQASTQASFISPGVYVLMLAASDGDSTGSSEVIVAVNQVNLAPVVNPGPAQTITLPANSLTLNGSVTDDGLPQGTSISINWSQVSGPGAATFSSPQSAITTATFPAAGSYVLKLTASDSELSSSATVSVTVNPQQPANQPPVVNAGPNLTITLPTSSVTINGSVTDDGLPAAGTLTVGWSQVSGPAAVTFSNPNQAVTQATFSIDGTYTLKLSASDGAFSSSSQMTVTVNPSNTSNQAPVVSASPNKAITLPNNNVTLNGSVNDDGLPTGAQLVVSWSQLTGPAAVSFSNPNQPVTQVTFGVEGTYVLKLTASDTELTSSATVTVVVNPVPPPPPLVSIVSPADGIEVTTATNIIGNVSDANISGVTWKVEYSLNSDDGSSNQTFTTFGTGSGSLTNGVAGVFDPTLLLNGTYLIRLSATDSSGQTSTASMTLVATRAKKIGNFTLSFNDLTVPVSGLAIQVIRTYDSRDKRKGDFGVGWTLGIKNVRVEKSGILGLAWVETVSNSLLPQWCLQPTKPRTVTITFPDDKVYKFQAGTSTQCRLIDSITQTSMIFSEVPGTSGTQGATLVALGDNGVLVDGTVPGPVNLLRFNGTLYNPTVFRLTTADKYVYIIDQKLGVTSMTDPNGNTLTINTNGIIHSSGKSIDFARDASGRITQVTDPAGNAMTYGYDANGDLISFRDRENNQTSFSYNNRHGLVTIIDPRGIQPIRNDYDNDGRLLRHTDAFGKVITYNHDLAANHETMTDRLGNSTLYEYDDRGNVVRMTDALGNVSSFTYDARDNKLTETNALGKTMRFTYDAFDNLLTQTDPLGNVTRYTYNNLRQVLTVTDPRNNVTTNGYDLKGNLTSTRDALGNTTSFTYGPSGLRLTMTDALNNVTRYSYDGNGNVVSEIDALGHATGFGYDANGNRVSQTTSRTVSGGAIESLVTTFEYDKQNRLTKTVYADGTSTQVVYNSIGQQISTIDQLGRQTQFAYDQMGRLTGTTHADGTSESSAYDAEGRRLSSVDRAGRTTRFDYDSLGRLTKTTYADGSFTTTQYDAIGRVSSTTDALGHVTSYEYDPNCGCSGRRTKITDALNHSTQFGYDANGNQQSMTDANGHVMSYEYDALNRRTKLIYDDGTFDQTGYDALGRVTSKTDQAGKVTQYGYDALGRLVSVTDALNQITQYGYDELGEQTSQTDALGRVTRFEYDKLGRRTKRTLPLGQVESYSYNSAGNLISRRDFNGKTTTYSYDSMNRLLSKTPDPTFGALLGAAFAAPITFTYSATGRRLTMTDVSGVTTYGYDNRDRLITKATPEGTLSYSYDSASNLLSMQSSNTNGVSVSYSYDQLNRLSTVSDNAPAFPSATNPRPASGPAGAAGVTTYRYDDVGNLAGYVYPNGVDTSHSYNSLNRLTSMSVVGPPSSVIASFTYELGPAGNRTAVTELNGRHVDYNYDDLYRLKSETIGLDPVTANNGVIGYNYDAVGNRLSRTSTVASIPSTTSTYNANDQLGSDTYDANGSTTGSGGNSYKYDFENRLLSLNAGTANAVTYLYDGDGNRVAKTVGGVMTKFLVDTNDPTGYAQVVEEIVAGNVQRVYVHGHSLISQSQLINNNWTGSFYGYDGHDSVRILTDGNGAITDSYTFDAFGNLIASTGSTPTTISTRASSLIRISGFTICARAT